MARLGFSLVWLDLACFGLFRCLKKMARKIMAGKKSRGKDLTRKRPNRE